MVSLLCKSTRMGCVRVCVCVCARVCVCVCRPLIAKRLSFLLFLLQLFNYAGGSGPLKGPRPAKPLLSWEDIQADHLDVPAIFPSVQNSNAVLSKQVTTSVGVTPSKELCNCVTSTGILAKGRA